MATLLTYDANNANPPTADDLAAGVTSMFTVGSGLGPVFFTSGSIFSARNWQMANSAANAAADGDFFSWTFSSPQPYDFTSLQISYGQFINGNGPRAIQIEVDVGNTGTFTPVFNDTTLSTTIEAPTIDLSGLMTGVTDATFRLLGFDQATDSFLDLSDNASFGGNFLRLNGDLTPAPPQPPPQHPLPLTRSPSSASPTPTATPSPMGELIPLPSGSPLRAPVPPKPLRFATLATVQLSLVSCDCQMNLASSALSPQRLLPTPASP